VADVIKLFRQIVISFGNCDFENLPVWIQIKKVLNKNFEFKFKFWESNKTEIFHHQNCTKLKEFFA
jgi:hypothetical protein